MQGCRRASHAWQRAIIPSSGTAGAGVGRSQMELTLQQVLQQLARMQSEQE
jgi:hypothetical protein